MQVPVTPPMTQPAFVDERAVIARIAQQEQSALTELYDRYGRVLYSLANRILSSSEEAEEVVLDVFAQVWKNASTYSHQRGRVDGWLFMMTRSRALDRIRSRKRQLRSVQAISLETKGCSEEDPVEEVFIAQRRVQVLTALEQLPSQQREALELAYFKGLTHVEISMQTNIPLGTIKTRLRLGLAKLREILTPELASP